MRVAMYETQAGQGIAVSVGNQPFKGVLSTDPSYPGDLQALIVQGRVGDLPKILENAPVIDEASITWLPPVGRPDKVVCIGLNYVDHAAEGGFEPPTYPTVFNRFPSSYVGHETPIILPRVSEQFDYECEIAVVMGRSGRNIPLESALDYVAGYSLFNDGSIRDYQFKSPQWAVGKNFDKSGSFGPWMVTPDDVPPGMKGATLQTRLNGEVLQSASTSDMIFDVATLISLLSEVFTWEPGDVIVSGTPAGVGLARTPPIWMKAGDICEIEATGLGILRNKVVAE